MKKEWDCIGIDRKERKKGSKGEEREWGSRKGAREEDRKERGKREGAFIPCVAWMSITHLQAGGQPEVRNELTVWNVILTTLCLCSHYFHFCLYLDCNECCNQHSALLQSLAPGCFSFLPLWIYVFIPDSQLNSQASKCLHGGLVSLSCVYCLMGNWLLPTVVKYILLTSWTFHLLAHWSSKFQVV